MSGSPVASTAQDVAWLDFEPRFAGYRWEVKEGRGGPSVPGGATTWSSSHVSVARAPSVVAGGPALRLKASAARGAEIRSKGRLGFGRYEWRVHYSAFDSRFVLGLFNYGGTDHVNELDIEITQEFTNVDGRFGNYTVYPPTEANGEKAMHSFDLDIEPGLTLRHIFEWTPTAVRFKTTTDSGDPVMDEGAQWLFSEPAMIPAESLHVHMNLWNRGSSSGEMEVYVWFDYTPISYADVGP